MSCAVTVRIHWGEFLGGLLAGAGVGDHRRGENEPVSAGLAAVAPTWTWGLRVLGPEGIRDDLYQCYRASVVERVIPV